jgi:hypothetical protein
VLTVDHVGHALAARGDARLQDLKGTARPLHVGLGSGDVVARPDDFRGRAELEEVQPTRNAATNRIVRVLIPDV